MTCVQHTMNFINTLAKGSVFTREEWWKMMTTHKGENGRIVILSIDQVLAQKERFGVERVISYRDTINSKYSAMDVVNLIKAGHSIEEVEAMLHTKTKQVSMRIL